MEDLVAYGVSESFQKTLWKEEIKRLIAAVNNPEAAIRFAGSEEYKVDSKEAHQSVAFLADKMFVALNITIHDSQAAIFKHHPNFITKTQILHKSHRRLTLFVADYDIDDADEDECRDTRLGTLDVNHADYFELVNYVTATISRILCKAASGKMWHEMIVAKLAKTAAKMKVVSENLRESAAASLQNSPSAKPAPSIGLGRVRGRNADLDRGDSLREHMLEDLQGMMSMLNRNESRPSFVGPHAAKRALTNMYHIYEMVMQHQLFDLYQSVLIPLRGMNPLQTSLSTSYEICAMLYRTGYGDSPVFLFQDIDGEYLGSSSEDIINVSHASFQVLNAAVNGLLGKGLSEEENFQNGNGHAANSANDSGQNSAENTTQTSIDGNSLASDIELTLPPPLKNQNSVRTKISWFYTETSDLNNSQKQEIELKTMSNVLTVMIPLILVSPIAAKMTTDSIGIFAFVVSEIGDASKPVLYRPTELNASFYLTTEEYCNMWKAQPQEGFVSQLSSSLVAPDTMLSWQTRKINGRRILTLPTNGDSPEERNREQQENSEHYHDSKNHFARASERMKDWVIEENGVRVRCDWYVATVSAVAVVLVLGAIAAGITMGQRLPGVDPFNITTFSWVVAAFIILMAKSARVASWTWWDFLHRQVLCRSVSELRAVTGIDDQIILAKLLQEESKTPLQTRGPYNTVFFRKASGGDGFSIDQPLSIRTMFLSGLILVQVQAFYHGKFLVCLDLRKGTDYNVLLQTRESVVDEEERIVSDRLVDEPLQGTMHRIGLKKEKTSWSRVIGVYGRKNSVFC